MDSNSKRADELKALVKKVNDTEIWRLYGLVEIELKTRGEIGSRNPTEERGEAVTIEIYRKTRASQNFNQHLSEPRMLMR